MLYNVTLILKLTENIFYRFKNYYFTTDTTIETNSVLALNFIFFISGDFNVNWYQILCVSEIQRLLEDKSACLKSKIADRK